MRRLLALVPLLALVAGCAAAGGQGARAGALVVVSAPLSSSPWIGTAMQRGAELAARQSGGRARVEVLDNAGSPQTVLAHARRAVAEGAAGLVVDGVGAKAVAAVTDPASLPVFVTFEGGASLVDPKAMPTLFRLAPSDTYLGRRLADYVSTRAKAVAVLSDDSTYGAEGTAATLPALARDHLRVTTRQRLPAGTSDASAQVLAARRSGAQALVVWTQAPGVAAVLSAARSAGWAVPVLSGPAAEDPLVRQRLAAHPGWLDGTTFVSWRITSEVGPARFAAYRAAYDAAYGPDRTGVTAGGRPVVEPPDWSAYSYDAVRLVLAALARSGGRTGQPEMAALDGGVVISGANGDERGFGPDDREGVSPDDMYFAAFHGMRFAPVTDDVLSTGLPTVPQ